MTHKPTPTKIVFIFEELDFGGTQKQYVEVARHLHRALFTPYFWTLRTGDALLTHDEKTHLAVLRNDESLRPLSAIVALAKALHKHKPALIHLCTTFPNVWGRILGRLGGQLVGKPVIVASCRGLINVRQQHERFLWPFAHAHICNARIIEKHLHAVRVPQNKVHYIANGVDTHSFSPAEKGLCAAPHVVCVGRMVKEKDHRTLIEAFAHVVQHMPEARLHLVGDGPLMGQTQKLVTTNDIAHAVYFHGASNKVKHYLHKARLLVLSSISEGMPNVILEGMACALPVVATHVGGIPDIVQDTRTGLLSPPQNARALAQNILTILQTAHMAERMGAAGRVYIEEHHSLYAVARQHEDVYTALLGAVSK